MRKKIFVNQVRIGEGKDTFTLSMDDYFNDHKAHLERLGVMKGQSNDERKARGLVKASDVVMNALNVITTRGEIDNQIDKYLDSKDNAKYLEDAGLTGDAKETFRRQLKDHVADSIKVNDNYKEASDLIKKMENSYKEYQKAGRTRDFLFQSLDFVDLLNRGLARDADAGYLNPDRTLLMSHKGIRKGKDEKTSAIGDILLEGMPALGQKLEREISSPVSPVYGWNQIIYDTPYAAPNAVPNMNPGNLVNNAGNSLGSNNKAEPAASDKKAVFTSSPDNLWEFMFDIIATLIIDSLKTRDLEYQNTVYADMVQAPVKTQAAGTVKENSEKKVEQKLEKNTKQKSSERIDLNQIDKEEKAANGISTEQKKFIPPVFHNETSKELTKKGPSKL